MKMTLKRSNIRQTVLTGLILLWSASSAFSQSYTIAQTTTGSSRDDLRGQIFVPSEQGDGSGTVHPDDTVMLTSFSVVYAGAEAPTLYIYSELPTDTIDLDGGITTGLIGESQAVSDNFPFTVYEFDSLKLHKDSTYYALFRQKVDLEFGGSLSEDGPYSGGKMIKNEGDASGTLTPNDFAALRFEAEFVRIPPNQQDVDALIALYDATDGTNWDNSWDLEASPYEWYGVTWEDQRVTELKIENNSLNGSLPAEIGDLTELTSLRLSNNSLTGSIPAEIGNLTQLTELYLLNNSLSGSIPSELGNLTNLFYLYLHGNSLSGSIPVELGNLASLNTLNLLNNSLSGSVPAELGNLTNLTTLSVHSNSLSGDIPTELAGLPNLNILYVNNNDFENLPDFSSSSLTQFGISNNKFTFEDIEPNESVITDNTGQKPFSDDEVRYLEQDESLTLQFTVGGSNNIYQWQKNGENIDGEINSTLEISSFSPTADTGTYQLLVTNSVVTDLTLESGNITIMLKEGPVNETDSLALVALYNSTNGTNWRNNEGWLEDPVKEWYGITVFNGRVVKIKLVANDLTGSLPVELGELENLVELRLGSNYSMNGSIPVELGNLSNLEILNLSYNDFSGEIPTELANLTKLSYLDLSHNELTGSIPVELSNLTKLTSLYLGYNLLAGSIPKELGNLIKLDHLGLGKNHLEGSIPAELGNLTSLIFLNLGFNSLEGELPAELGNLTNLTGLYLGNNYHLSGAIPAELGNLTSLSDLFLNYNSFEGAIPTTLNNLTLDGRVYLNDNNFEDLPEMSSWSPYIFTITSNRFTFEDIEPNLSAITGSKEQKPFSEDSVYYPKSGDNLTLQFTVGGANNVYQWQKNGENIEGETSDMLEIPNFSPASDTGTYQLLVTNTLVTDLTLKSGNITLTVPLVESDSLALVALYNNTNGASWTNNEGWLEKPVNKWYGINTFGGRVTGIDLKNNGLEGTIPIDLADLAELKKLNLGNNSLSGSIPVELSTLANLTTLYLYSNSLSGAIPPELGNLTELTNLNLSRNTLNGKIPKELGNLPNLAQLTLDDNSLTGTIPAELGALTNLTSLYLSNNQLEEEIPHELGALVNLKYLILDNNLLSGAIPAEFGNLAQLQRLDLQSNSLSGSIPVELGNLTELRRLNLSLNDLTGDVPIEFQNLTLLETLSLRDNLLEEMPDLSSLPLWEFEVQFNKFTFEDLEPNKGLITAGYLQHPFGEVQTYEVANGDNQVLSFDIGGENSSYQWTKDGENILGATGISYTIAAMNQDDAGEYKLKTINSLFPGLTLVSEPISIVSEVVTGIGMEASATDIRFYPNPMQESTTLYVPETEGKMTDVQVFDLTGSEVPFQLSPIGYGKYALSIANDKRGVLLIRIDRKGTSVYRKLIKN